jgi:hypothetical protein
MHYGDQPMQRRTVPGDLIHSDICGWITPNSLGNARYFITFIDDATRMTYLYILPLKAALEVKHAFMEFRNVFEQDGRRVKSIRTDGGGEYRKQMAELCKELGIHHEETASYQNGVAERAIRTICERIRSIIAETKLLKGLWAELAHTVVYLKIEQKSTRSLKDKTPFEALYGVKPDLSHLIAVGTKAMPHIPKSKNQKLDPRAGEGIMVGYRGSNQYRIWNPIDNKVTVTAYADFINEAKNHATAVEPERIIYDMVGSFPVHQQLLSCQMTARKLWRRTPRTPRTPQTTRTSSKPLQQTRAKHPWIKCVRSNLRWSPVSLLGIEHLQNAMILRHGRHTPHSHRQRRPIPWNLALIWKQSATPSTEKSGSSPSRRNMIP